MDSILVCMDLGDKAHTYHRDIFSHMNASHNLVELRINFNILFFCFHKMQHFFLFCKNIQMSIQFSKDHKDLRDIFYYIHEQDNLKVYYKDFRNWIFIFKNFCIKLSIVLCHRNKKQEL